MGKQWDGMSPQPRARRVKAAPKVSRGSGGGNNDAFHRKARANYAQKVWDFTTAANGAGGGQPSNNPYANIASANLGNTGTTNAPGVSGGGVPAVSAPAAPSPITAEYNTNKAAIDAAYAANAAQLNQLQQQYQASAGQIGTQQAADYQGARNITGAEDAAVNRDLAAQGATAGSPIAAQQRLEQSTLADAHMNQQNLLNQNNQLHAQDYFGRAAAGNAAQASSQSALLQAYQAAQAQAAADAAGGGGGGGGGHGGGGGSGSSDGSITPSDFNYAQDVANQQFGESNRLKAIRQAQHDYLAGQSYDSHHPLLRAALHDLRNYRRTGQGNPQALLASAHGHPLVRDLILQFIKNSQQAGNKRYYAGKNQVNSTLKRLFG